MELSTFLSLKRPPTEVAIYWQSSAKNDTVRKLRSQFRPFRDKMHRKKKRISSLLPKNTDESFAIH